MGLQLKFLRISPDLKRPIDKFDDAKPYEEVQDCSDIGLVVPNGYVVLDVDDGDQSEVLLKIIKDKGIRTKVMQTTRGMHFWFRTPNVLTNNIKILTPIGISVDVKSGGKKSYVKIKHSGQVRPWLINYEDLEVIPNWLLPNKNSIDFWNLDSGSRNDTFFRAIITLQSFGMEKDEVKETLNIVNDYIMKEPLAEDELEVITRDEAFDTKVAVSQESGYMKDGKFHHHLFGDLLNSKLTPVTIDGTMYIYNRGFYEVADREAERGMIDLMPSIKRNQRTEVLEYMKLVTMKFRDEIPENPYVVNLLNTRLDIRTNEQLPFTPMAYDFNKIPVNYDPTAYDEDLDKMLDKVFCGDAEIRKLFEEFVGYLFLGNNKYGKMILLVGDGSNGKSTILDLLKTLIGDSNYETLALNEIGDKFKTADLENKMLNIGDDIDNDMIRMTGVLKKAVTGEEMQVERKNEHPFKLRNKAKLMFSANEIPYIQDKTYGMERRLIIIPMNARFTPDDDDFDPFIEDKIKTPKALSYLLNLGLKAFQRVLKTNEFTTPKEVTMELFKYKIRSSHTLTWIRDQRISLDHLLSKSIHSLHSEMQGFLSIIGVRSDRYPNVNTFMKEIQREFKLGTTDVGVDTANYMFTANGLNVSNEPLIDFR